MNAYGRRGSIAPLFKLDPSVEVSGKLYAPAAVFPGKDVWYPLDIRLGEPQEISVLKSLLIDVKSIATSVECRY
jgi:hypothetical protein